MVEVIEQIRPALVIPMHYFSPFTLARFLALVRERYDVVISETPSVTLARATLLYRQEIEPHRAMRFRGDKCGTPRNAGPCKGFDESVRR